MVPVPFGTVAVIVLYGLTVNDVALAVPNLTSVAPTKLSPDIVTRVPIGPEASEVLFIIGGDVAGYIKLLLLEVPAGTVTVTVAAALPGGTIAVILLFDEDVTVALVVLNQRSGALVKLSPDIVTGVPIGPKSGEMLVIIGR